MSGELLHEVQITGPYGGVCMRVEGRRQAQWIFSLADSGLVVIQVAWEERSGPGRDGRCGVPEDKRLDMGVSKQGIAQ